MRGQAAHRGTLGRGTLATGLVVALSLVLAAPANATLLDRFVTSGNATASWIAEPNKLPGVADQFSIQLSVNARSAVDFNDAAWVTFEGFPPAPPAAAPSFFYKVSDAGPSGGSVRFVMRYNDGGFGFLRPVTLQPGVWQFANGAGGGWENVGGSCTSASTLTYSEMVACHPGASVTSVEIINDSGWLHAGRPFTALVDYLSYGADVATVPAPPVLGKSLNASLASGKVLVRLPEGSPATGVRASAAAISDLDRVDGVVQGLPVGSRVDARRGAVRLISAKGGARRRQSGRFSGAVFTVSQTKTRDGLTTLRLKKAPRGRCRSARGAQVAPVADTARRRRGFLRRLRARARGRFRTRGRYSSAIVQGTRWTVTELCRGTLVSVSEGAVLVRDPRRHRTVVVRAGRSYLARAPGY